MKQKLSLGMQQNMFVRVVNLRTLVDLVRSFGRFSCVERVSLSLFFLSFFFRSLHKKGSPTNAREADAVIRKFSFTTVRTQHTIYHQVW